MADVYRDDDGEVSIGDDVVERIFKLRKDSSKHQSRWRRDAQEDFQFRDGEQWDSEDVSILEQQNRPVVTFNRCMPIIDSIVGNEVGNRQEVRYFPRTMGDREPNETYTEGARWVRQECDAEDEESDAYKDAVTCGMGWVEYRVDTDEDPEGKIVIERVPPMEMRWDPAARKSNLVDAKWLLREKWMDLDDVRERWPNLKDEVLAGSDTQVDSEWIDEHDSTTAWQYKQDQRWWDEKEKKVLVIQFQEKVREPFYRVMGPESVEELTEEQFERLQKKMPLPEDAYVRLHRFTYKQCFIAGKTKAEEGKPPIDGFSFFCITAKRDEEHGTWFGLMRSMKDPQRWANKFFSQAMYIFSTNSKGGLVVEEDAVDDTRALEESWASADAINWVNPGTISGNKIWQKDLGGYPSSLDKLLQFAIASIRDVSGVNLELLGMADREQPGVLEVERKKAALVILAPLLSSLRRYRKISGRALLEFMRTYISPHRMMRITDKAVEFMPDDSVVQYDVIVDTAPNSPNLKQEVWGQLTQIVPALVKAGVPIPPDLIRFSPLPESVAEKWIEYVSQSSQVSPEIQKQMEELQSQVADLEGKNKMLSDKREMNMMTLEHKRQEMILEQQREEQRMALEARRYEQEMLWKAKMSDADRAAKLMEIQAEYDTEMAKIQQQALLQQESVRAQCESEREKSAFTLQLEREKSDSSMQMEREKIAAQREEKARKDLPSLDKHIDSKLTPLAQLLAEIKKSVEDLNQRADEAKARREVIVSYLESQGGDAAIVARRLN